MKTLHSLSLESMARNFHRFAEGRLELPSGVKEQLLHLMFQHDLLNPVNKRAITYHLISPGLRYLDLDRTLQVDDALLTHIGMIRCEFVEIRISKCGGISDTGLGELLINQSCLEKLCLEQLQIKGTSLKSLRCPNTLRELCISGCSAVEGVHVAAALSRHHDIMKLTLKKIRNLSADDMSTIAGSLGENLQDLDLVATDNLEDKGLLALADNCPKLQSLKISGSSKLSSSVVEHLIDVCSDLQELEFSYFGLSSGLSRGFVKSLPSQLVSLTLFGMIQTDCPPEIWSESIGYLTHLKKLNLSGSNLVSDEFLDSLLSSIGAQLEELDLSGNMGKLTDNGMSSIGKYCTEGLDVLALNLMPGISFRPLVGWIRRPATHSRIKGLRIACCVDACDEFIWAIAEHCSVLESLDLSGLKNTAVNDELLRRLAETCGQNLSHISLRANQDVTDDGVVALAFSASNLVSCSLAGLKKVSDKSILSMANHCHYLQELYLNGCSLVSQQALNYLQDECIGRVTVYHLNPSRSNHADYVVAKNLNTGQYCHLELMGPVTQ